MDNFSRRYYEKELGAGVGPSLSGTEHFGYTQPFRRFVQNELFTPQANEIRNDAPSWLPGDDYYTNFHNGDPFLKVPEGYARLPGAGYETLYPELEGMNREDYPSTRWPSWPTWRPTDGSTTLGIFVLWPVWNHRKELPKTRRIFTYLHIYESLAAS